MHHFLENLTTNDGAPLAVIGHVEEELGRTLPKEYVDFLKLANGAEGFVGETSYVMLWRVEELAPLNKAYEVEEYAPGLLIFGSDGGGEAYGFDTREVSWSIVAMPFVGMDWGLSSFMASSFRAFMEKLHEARP